MPDLNFELETLKNLAYNFYPKNLSPNEEAYHQSQEFKALLNILSLPNKANLHLEELLKDEIQVNFVNCTHQTFLDWAFNWQFHLSPGQIETVSLYIIKIIPFYTIKNLKVLTNRQSNWIKHPTVNFNPSLKIKSITDKTDLFVSSKLNLKKLPDEYEDFLLENIEFQEIRNGKFTIFNAYFLDEYFIK